MEYNKTKINNFVLHTIKSNNFKSIKITINFRRKLSKKEATLNSFLFFLLIYRTKKYDYKSLLEKKEDLYSLIINSNIDYENSKYKNSSIEIKFLHPKYTQNNQEIESLKLFKEILFNPIFDDLSTNNKIKELIKTKLISLKENKRIYARNLMSKKLNTKFPSKYGYVDELDSITPEQIEEYYNDVFSNDQVDIFVVGDINSKLYIDFFKDMFKTNVRHKKSSYYKYKDIKIKEYKEKEKELSQAKLLVALKPIDYDLKKELEISVLYGAVLGSGISSKLFRVIREENSLAYYTSIYREDYQTAVLEAGIDVNNYEKTLELMKFCISDMNNITDEDLNTANMIMTTDLKSLEYNQSGIINFYLNREIKGDNMTIEDKINKLNSVSILDIKNFNKKVNIDSILLYGDINE